MAINLHCVRDTFRSFCVYSKSIIVVVVAWRCANHRQCLYRHCNCCCQFKLGSIATQPVWLMIGFRKFIEYVTLLRELEAVDMWCDSGEPVGPTKTCNFDLFYRIKKITVRNTLTTGTTGVHGEVRISLQNVWWIVYRSTVAVNRNAPVTRTHFNVLLALKRLYHLKAKLGAKNQCENASYEVFFRKAETTLLFICKLSFSVENVAVTERRENAGAGWIFCFKVKRQLTSNQLKIECRWLRLLRMMKTVHFTWLPKTEHLYGLLEFPRNTHFLFVDQKLPFL